MTGTTGGGAGRTAIGGRIAADLVLRGAAELVTMSRPPAEGLGAVAGAALAGWHPFPATVWLLPAALVPWIAVSGGLAMAVAALSVHYRDLRDLSGHLLNLLFFSSPIIYSLEGLELPPPLERLLRLNPLAALVEVYRDAVFTGTFSPWDRWAVALATGLVVWSVGVWVFARHRDTVVEAV